MRKLRKVAIPLVCVLLGYLIGELLNAGMPMKVQTSIVATRWSGTAQQESGLESFYGAQVYTVRTGKNAFSVRGQVWIGGGGEESSVGYFDDLGELGTAANWDEAVKTWGQIDWSDTALTIGPGKTGPVVVPRTRIENHR